MCLCKSVHVTAFVCMFFSKGTYVFVRECKFAIIEWKQSDKFKCMCVFWFLLREKWRGRWLRKEVKWYKNREIRGRDICREGELCIFDCNVIPYSHWSTNLCTLTFTNKHQNRQIWITLNKHRNLGWKLRKICHFCFLYWGFLLL